MSGKPFGTKWCGNFPWKRVSIFTLGGVANTVVDFIIFNTMLLLYPTDSPFYIAGYSGMGFLIANIQGYWIHRTWTFRYQEPRKSHGSSGRFSSFFMISIVSLWMNSTAFLSFQLFFDQTAASSLWLNMEKFIASGFGVIWNYIGYQWFVFRKTSDLKTLRNGTQCYYKSDMVISPKYSVVIPAYNETERIHLLLDELSLFQKEHPDLEIIIVDDGSMDQTSEKISTYYSKLANFSHYRFACNQGKGGAVRFGLSHAVGEYIFFCDADLSFPLGQLLPFSYELQQHADLVVGHRQLSSFQPLGRKLMSWFFRKMVHILQLTCVTDTQCGFKGFRRDALKQILPHTYCTDFAFDIEILAVARNQKLKIAEKRLEWIHRNGSTLRFSHIFQMIFSLIAIRLRLLPAIAMEWRICAGLFLVAFLVRLPYLFDVPHFIDEWGEVRLAAQISRGEVWPLHNTAHDIGAFYNYVLAGLFALFGPHLYLPRLFVVTVSAATVVLTYLLARHWASSLLSVFAALLLATDSMHILVTHMAWSNDITPFFVVLSLLFTLKALESKTVFGWVLAGFTWSIALQTHSSVLAPLIGVFGYVGYKYVKQKSLQRKCVLAGLAAFTFGYSNMIVHNILHPLDSVFWIHRKDYALNMDINFTIVLKNLVSMFSELLHALASAFPAGHGVLHHISQMVLLFFLLGLALGIRKLLTVPNGGLLVSVLPASFVIIPLFNSRYVFYISTRYIAFLFPICFVMIAFGLAALTCRLPCLKLWQPVARRVCISAFAGSLFFALPLHHFYSYAAEYVQLGEDNSAEYLTVEKVLRMASQDTLIVVDALAKQGKAVSEMLKVKGKKIELVGLGFEYTLEESTPKTEKLNFNRWQKVLARNHKDILYILSAENEKRLTKQFHLHWKQSTYIAGTNQQRAYFIGELAQ